MARRDKTVVLWDGTLSWTAASDVKWLITNNTTAATVTDSANLIYSEELTPWDAFGITVWNWKISGTNPTWSTSKIIFRSVIAGYDRGAGRYFGKVGTGIGSGHNDFGLTLRSHDNAGGVTGTEFVVPTAHFWLDGSGTAAQPNQFSIAFREQGIGSGLIPWSRVGFTINATPSASATVSYGVKIYGRYVGIK